jgi:hypothetical protein
MSIFVLDMISNIIIFLFGITFVGSSLLPTIPVPKYVPNCKGF